MAGVAALRVVRPPVPTRPPGALTIAVGALPRTRLLLLAAGVAVVVTLAGGGVWWWLEAREREATAAYLAVLRTLATERPPTSEARAAVARDLETVLARHPTSPLAALAAWELGNLRWAQRDWPGARAAWEIATARTASPTLRTLARASIAYTWEAERNYERAAAAFESALQGLGPGDFQYADLLLDLGRVQELGGKRDAAIATYRKILKEVPNSPRADEVRVRLARLGAAA